MKSERANFRKALLFIFLFATLIFVSAGCAGGITAFDEAWNPEAPLARGGGGGGTTAPEEDWNKTFGGTYWQTLSCRPLTGVTFLREVRSLTVLVGLISGW